MQRVPTVSGTTNLLDILDRVLDKGLVIAGDIRVSLANVELLTIKIRLLVCSIDKAQEIGLDWWRHDAFLSSQGAKADEALLARLETIERLLAAAPQSVQRTRPAIAKQQAVTASK